MYEVWGSVDPSVRRRGIGTWLMRRNVDRARQRAEREDPGTDVALGDFSEEVEAGHRGSPRRIRVHAGPPFLPDAPRCARHRRRPAAPRRHRDPAGDRGSAPGDRRRRERGVPRPLGPPRDDRERRPGNIRPGRARHRPVGRRLGRRRGGRRRPELGLARGERASWGQARLARAHQRPPAMAAARARPGDHRAVAHQAPRSRSRRSDARRRLGESERCARALRGARFRGLQPGRGLPPAARARLATASS